MSNWTPDWQLNVNGYDYTSITISNLTINSGRTDFYLQTTAGSCNVELLNTDPNVNVVADINDQVSIQVKDSSGTLIPIFGGYVTDVTQSVTSAGSVAITQKIRITAMGALAKLSKTLTDGVLSKALDGVQIASILEPLLFNTWSEVPAALTWATYSPTETWANASNSGVGQIDTGEYELAARTAARTDVYSLVAALATSGLGYLYEDGQGRICYADASHRSEYLATYGYSELDARQALTDNLSISRRSGDLRNSLTIKYKNNAEVSLEDAASITTYGTQGQVITTSLENGADATFQAAFYLDLRANPSDRFSSITYQLVNPELDDTDRDALLGVFMGLPIDIQNLPSNMIGGQFQGFVEGWTFRANYNKLSVTLNLSPVRYSLQAMQWEQVPATETWASISPTLDWLNATLVS